MKGDRGYGEGLRLRSPGPLPDSRSHFAAVVLYDSMGAGAHRLVTPLRISLRRGFRMRWDIVRYDSASGDSRDVSKGDRPPSVDDLELGEHFLLHIVDADDIDRYYWVHGGLPLGTYDYDVDAAMEALITQLAKRYGFHV